MVSLILRLKLRLQFSGWLQYIPTALIALVFLLIAALANLLGKLPAYPFWVIGGLLLAVVIFDLITVKLQLRPAEPLPTRKENLDAFDLMRARRSCRSFQSRKLTPADFSELMERVRVHSHEVTIGRSAIRFEYVSARLTVWPVVGASEFLVAIAPSQYSRLAVIDVGQSLQKIVIDATRMGLATCWIGPGADHTSIERHLGERYNPEKDHIICICAVGYRSWFLPFFLRFMQLQFHRRRPLSSLFFADDHCTQPQDITALPFNRFGRCYEVCQWAPSSYNGQTTRCAAVIEKNGEHAGCLQRFDFYAATGSRYYAAVALGIWCANWEMGCAALGLHGYFAVLPAQARGVDEPEASTRLPRYDVSWVLEDHF